MSYNEVYYGVSLVPRPTSGRHFIPAENKVVDRSGSGYETNYGVLPMWV